jgi:hypothetical protein
MRFRYLSEPSKSPAYLTIRVEADQQDSRDWFYVGMLTLKPEEWLEFKQNHGHSECIDPIQAPVDANGSPVEA